MNHIISRDRIDSLINHYGEDAKLKDIYKVMTKSENLPYIHFAYLKSYGSYQTWWIKCVKCGHIFRIDFNSENEFSKFHNDHWNEIVIASKREYLL